MKKWIILVVMLLLVGLATYHFVRTSQKESKQTVQLQAIKPGCDPVAFACKAGDGQHAVTLRFPEKVAYLKPFKIQVTIQGFRQEVIEKINVDFKMVGMDMGLNRFTLSSVVDEKGNISYQGEGILPVCVSGRVDWIANTQVMTTDKDYEAIFKFKVAK